MARVRDQLDRRRAERLGRIAEWLCCLVLWLKGYRILATRLRLPMGEIDIIAAITGAFCPRPVRSSTLSPMIPRRRRLMMMPNAPMFISV